MNTDLNAKDRNEAPWDNGIDAAYDNYKHGHWYGPGSKIRVPVTEETADEQLAA